MTIKVAALSDLHGDLSIKIPPCHACLIAGDLCPWGGHRHVRTVADQALWLATEFRAWVKDQPCPRFFVTWGNHDWVGEKIPHLVPKIPNVEFLCDSGSRLAYDRHPEPDEEYKVWGTPWQPPFYDWAFNLPDPDLAAKWELIPMDTDILICHGPPRNFGDMVAKKAGRKLADHELETPDGVLVGSHSLYKRIAVVQPKLVVFGHIHPGRGKWQLAHPSGRKSILANVAVVNDEYKIVHEPMVFEL